EKLEAREVLRAHLLELSALAANTRHDAVVLVVLEHVGETRVEWWSVEPLRHRGDAYHRQASGGERQPSHGSGQRRPAGELQSSSAQPFAVAPRRELGAQRLPDADEIQPFAQRGEPYVVRGNPQRRCAEGALALLDRLPALLYRCEVPVAALRADRPEPPLS